MQIKYFLYLAGTFGIHSRILIKMPKRGDGMPEAPLIIGLTGSFGSGCSHISEKYLEPNGFKRVSLSQSLKELYHNDHKQDADTREKLQDYGNNLRRKHGSDYLARKAVSIIGEQGHDKWVIDSLKNPNEVKLLRNTFSKFFLIGVFAEYSVRWTRVRGKYKDNEGEFKRDDIRDGSEDQEFGQRVRDCFVISDIIIANNIDYTDQNDDQMEMEGKIENYLSLINNPSIRPPTEDEAIMAMAYANSQRSSCLKRKVGAVIVDENGSLFSSGYNDVPFGERPCRNAHGKCYRSILKEDLSQKINEAVDDPDGTIKNKILKGNKMLDHCRALHAEENAILNIAKFGSASILSGATLYTTTYPCNLCANKIAQVKIAKVVYFEPYPMEEAKKLLTAKKIEQKPFEGVSFKGYFKLFGGESS